MEFLYKEHVKRNFESDLIFFPMLYFGPNFCRCVFRMHVNLYQLYEFEGT